MTMSCQPHLVQQRKLPLALRPISFLLFMALVAFAATPAFGAQQETEDDPKAVNLYNRASSLFNDKEFETAIGQFDQVLEKYPGFSGRRDALYFAGMAHCRLNQFDKGLARLESRRDSLPTF